MLQVAEDAVGRRGAVVRSAGPQRDAVLAEHLALRVGDAFAGPVTNVLMSSGSLAGATPPVGAGFRQSRSPATRGHMGWRRVGVGGVRPLG